MCMYLVAVVDALSDSGVDTVLNMVLVVELGGLGSDVVLLVQGLGLGLGGLDVSLDPANKAVLGINLEALLDDLVLEAVSSSENLGQDSDLGLVLLGNTLAVGLRILEVGLDRDLAVDNHGVGQHAGSLGGRFCI